MVCKVGTKLHPNQTSNYYSSTEKLQIFNAPCKIVYSSEKFCVEI